MKIGLQIQLFMIKDKQTQAQFALQSDLGEKIINQLVAGHEPSAQQLTAIAKGLKMSESEFLAIHIGGLPSRMLKEPSEGTVINPIEQLLKNDEKFNLRQEAIYELLEKAIKNKII